MHKIMWLLWEYDWGRRSTWDMWVHMWFYHAFLLPSLCSLPRRKATPSQTATSWFYHSTISDDYPPSRADYVSQCIISIRATGCYNSIVNMWNMWNVWLFLSIVNCDTLYLCFSCKFCLCYVIREFVLCFFYYFIAKDYHNFRQINKIVR